MKQIVLRNLLSEMEKVEKREKTNEGASKKLKTKI